LLDHSQNKSKIASYFAKPKKEPTESALERAKFDPNTLDSFFKPSENEKAEISKVAVEMDESTECIDLTDENTLLACKKEQKRSLSAVSISSQGKGKPSKRKTTLVVKGQTSIKSFFVKGDS
jgi:hypothetical protein